MTTYHKGTTRKTSIYNEEKQTENNCDMCHNKTDVLFLNIEWDSNTHHALNFFQYFCMFAGYVMFLLSFKG